MPFRRAIGGAKPPTFYSPTDVVPEPPFYASDFKIQDRLSRRGNGTRGRFLGLTKKKKKSVYMPSPRGSSPYGSSGVLLFIIALMLLLSPPRRCVSDSPRSSMMETSSSRSPCRWVGGFASLRPHFAATCLTLSPASTALSFAVCTMPCTPACSLPPQ